MKRWAWVLAVTLPALAAGAEDEKTQEAPAPAVQDAVAEAEAQLAAGDTDGALKTLEKGSNLPGTPGGSAGLRLGTLRESRGELDNAIDAYTAAAAKLEGAPKGEALGRAAVLQYTRGMAEASGTAEAAVAADPEGAWPTIAMSYRDVHEGDVDEGVRLARKAVDAEGEPRPRGPWAMRCRPRATLPEPRRRTALPWPRTRRGWGRSSVWRACCAPPGARRRPSPC